MLIRGLLSLLWLLTFEASSASADNEPFQVFTRGGDMRTLAADFAELNGDGRTDLLQIVSDGIPPDEIRSVRVYLQDDSGALPKEPSFERVLPENSAAYDIADVRPTPGEELLLLQLDQVAILSLAKADQPILAIDLEGAPSVGTRGDERGMDRLQMVYPRKNKPDWIRIPTFKGLLVLNSTGDTAGLLNSGGRANFYVPQKPGLAFIESDIQIFYDAPHVSTGDINGDGREDLLSATRHEVLAFYQKPDGTFASDPNQKLPLGLITPEDHIRGSGGIVVEGEDVNGDALMDLLVTKLSGGFSNSRTETRIYLNREGTWNLQEPDRSYASESTVGLDRLIDLDSDGRPELVREQIEFSLLELVETLLTQSLDTTISIHSPAEEGVFSPEPIRELDVEIPLSFDTFRPAGFIPTLDTDLNNDGFRDLLLSEEGDRVDVYLGRPDFKFNQRDAQQSMDSRGQLRLGDWNSDGLTDLLIFDPQNPASKLRLVVNQGTLTVTDKEKRRIRSGDRY